MRLIQNTGNDRVIDLLRDWLVPGSSVDVMSPAFSIFAYAEVRELLESSPCRLLLGAPEEVEASLFGGSADIAARGRLQGRWVAELAADWIKARSEVRYSSSTPPQSLISVVAASRRRTLLGTCAITTEGLGLAPSAGMGLVQSTDMEEEASAFADWFQANWTAIKPDPSAKAKLVERLEGAASQQPPALVYFQILHQLFKDLGDELDEERIIKSATGIRDTIVWKKLYRFQRDGVIGAIDKLERLGGCIIADSVGLGKTFEALAVIKYYELRNDRVLVLCPKRLRDNWTLYKANDRRNVLAGDRLNYDVLNHTDLSRDGGLSGDIDLSHVNWGNYDLVVIDESHNFRNKATHRDRDTRYDHLMKRIFSPA